MTPERRVSLLEAQADSTSRRIEKSLIPYFGDEKFTRFVSSYHFDGTNHIVRTNELVYTTDKLRFFTPAKYIAKSGTRNRKLNYLVANRIIEPFLLFIDNKFVKWSDITIRYNSKQWYIIISGEYNKNKNYKIKMIHIPFNVKYTENNTVANESIEIFRFDNEGMLSNTGNTVIYMNPYSDIYFNSITVENDLHNEEIPIDVKYKLRPENFIIFSDGVLNEQYHLEVLPMNIINATFGEVESTTYKIFYSRRIEYNIDNYRNLGENETYIKHAIKAYNNDNMTIPDVYKKSLDFSRDPSLSDEENMANSLASISAYNSALLEDDLVKIASTVIKSGKEIKDMMIEQNESAEDGGYDHGNITMIRYTARPTDNSVMIFKNGLLYDKQCTVKYKLHYFTFDVNLDETDDNDVFEFIFYSNVRNTILENIPVDENGYIPYVEATLPADSITILAHEASYNTFTLIETEYAYYELDFTVEDDKLKITDPFYNGKTVTIITKNHFEYAKYEMNETSNRLFLGGVFKYYYKHANYMVFINGKKINPGFRVVVPMNDTPVFGSAIYLELEYNEGDRVEVFYLPESIKMDMIRPTYNLVRRVYTNPSIMTYKIPVPYDNFFTDKNYMQIYNEYGKEITNYLIDYDEKTITFLADSRIELSFDYKLYDFLARIDQIMMHEDAIIKRFDVTEIYEHDKYWYTTDPAVIDRAHEIVDEMFGNERAGILRLFHKMVDNCLDEPSRLEWAIRSGLPGMFTYLRVSEKLKYFMEEIDKIMEKRSSVFKCFDDTEAGTDDFYYTNDPAIIAQAHALVDEIFGEEPDTILTLFHRMVDDSGKIFKEPAEGETAVGPIEWALRVNLEEMFVNPFEFHVSDKVEFDRIMADFMTDIAKLYPTYEEHSFRCYDSTEIGTDRLYYTNDPNVIEQAHAIVDERFAGQSQRIRDILHMCVSDSYQSPSRAEWSLRMNLPEMFIYIDVANRVDAFMEDVYSIARNRYSADLDDITLFATSPNIITLLHEKVKEWFGEEPQFIIDLFDRLVDEAFRKPTNIPLSLRLKLSRMFTMIPYVIVFHFRYRGGEIGLNHSGYLRIRREESPVGISRDNALIFVNGKKIMYKDIENISSSLIKITSDIHTINNLNVIRIVEPEDWIKLCNTNIAAFRSVHDSFMISKDTTTKNNLHNTFNHISITEDEMLYDVEPEMIHNGIIADFYLDQDIVLDEEFNFPYDKDGYFQYGNVSDATVYDNTRRPNIIDPTGIRNHE